VPGVDPVVTAAWIAAGVGGGVGVVGTIVGSRNTRKATEQAMAASTASTTATLTAAHEAWLREKRAAIYEETLAALEYRMMKRPHDLHKYRMDDESEQGWKDFFATYEPLNWFQAQGRMTGYASDTVRDAYKVSQQADLEWISRCAHYRMLAEDNDLLIKSGNLGAVADAQTMIEASKARDTALDAAQAADEAVIKLIRDENSSKPEAAALPAPLPPQRRKRWHRH
jgi:hypothetical protein